MSEVALAPNNVVLTDRAAKRIGRILSKQGEGTVLRIAVAGGGCSGFQYEYNLVKETPTADDLVLTNGSATVLIDSLSLEFMGGAWGHNWIIDRTNKLTIAVLTNVAPEGCNGPFREDIRDAVYASL